MEDGMGHIEEEWLRSLLEGHGGLESDLLGVLNDDAEGGGTVFAVPEEKAACGEQQKSDDGNGSAEGSGSGSGGMGSRGDSPSVSETGNVMGSTTDLERGDEGSDDEKKKARLQRNREKNREAAHLSRQRKKMYLDELEQKCHVLQTTNSELRALVGRLTVDNMQMRQQLALLSHQKGLVPPGTGPPLGLVRSGLPGTAASIPPRVVPMPPLPPGLGKKKAGLMQTGAPRAPASPPRESPKRKADAEVQGASGGQATPAKRASLGVVATLAALSCVMIIGMSTAPVQEMPALEAASSRRQLLAAPGAEYNVTAVEEATSLVKHQLNMITGKNETFEEVRIPPKAHRKVLEESVPSVPLDNESVGLVAPGELASHAKLLGAGSEDSSSIMSMFKPVMCVEVMQFDTSTQHIETNKIFADLEKIIHGTSGKVVQEEWHDSLSLLPTIEADNDDAYSMEGGPSTQPMTEGWKSYANEPRTKPFTLGSPADDEKIVSLLVPSTPSGRLQQLFVVVLSDVTRYVTYSCKFPSSWGSSTFV